jgi:geranylgeranylglycerol-phosphate geranylgeranyltransferase
LQQQEYRIDRSHQTLGWVKIARPVNMVLTFASVMLGAYLASDFAQWTWGKVLAAAASASLILAAGNAFNDLRDQPSDVINHPDYPLVTGEITRQGAWRVAITCEISGLLLAIVVSPMALAVAILVALLLVAYSLYLESVPFWGNLSVAVMAALTFPFGGIALGTVHGTEYPAIFALLFHLAREIVKDLQDRQGDALAKINTIAVRFGVQFPRIVVSAVLGLLIIATIVPYLSGVYNLTYFLIALLGVDGFLVGMIWILWTSEDTRSLRLVSMGLKAGMAVGLIAIVLG